MVELGNNDIFRNNTYELSWKEGAGYFIATLTQVGDFEIDNLLELSDKIGEITDDSETPIKFLIFKASESLSIGIGDFISILKNLREAGGFITLLKENYHVILEARRQGDMIQSAALKAAGFGGIEIDAIIAGSIEHFIDSIVKVRDSEV